MSERAPAPVGMSEKLVDAAAPTCIHLSERTMWTIAALEPWGRAAAEMRTGHWMPGAALLGPGQADSIVAALDAAVRGHPVISALAARYAREELSGELGRVDGDATRWLNIRPSAEGEHTRLTADPDEPSAQSNSDAPSSARPSGARWLPIRVADVAAWKVSLLEGSAQRLGVQLAEDGMVHRWSCVGSPVIYRGDAAWLRAAPFLEHEMDRTAWRGTVDAAAIADVRKPELLAHIEWSTDGPAPVPVSAELLTLVTDPIASSDRYPRHMPRFDNSWFDDLRTSLTALAAFPTNRRFPVHDAAEYGHLLHATYRRPIPAELVPEFGTEHVDLAWDNITAPAFQIFDMEHWGQAVTGYGAAYLYLTALSTPTLAERVHAELSDLLDTPSGRYAQLVAGAIILRNLTRLPDPGDLASAVHRHTGALLGA